MRIAIFTDSYLPQRNGVAVSIFRQVATLRGNCHQTLVVGPDCLDVDVFIPTVRLIKTRDMRYSLQWPTKLYIKELDEFKPNLIHIHTPFAIGAFGLMYSKKHGINVIYTHHTNFEFYYHYTPWLNNILGRYLWRAYYKKFLHSMNRIITPSQHSRLVVSNFYKIDLKRIRSISTQIDIAVRLVSVKKRFDIAFVGRLSSEKNIHLLLEVIQKLVHANPNITIAIVGDGMSRTPFFLGVLSESLDGNIHYMGELDNSSTIKIISESRFLLSTSISETQGLTVQEAWSVGVTPICVDCDSVREFVTNGVNGWITSINGCQIVSEINRLLSQKCDMDPKIVKECYRSGEKYSGKKWLYSYTSFIAEIKCQEVRENG